MENEKTQLPKNREFTRLFQEIDDEITILSKSKIQPHNLQNKKTPYLKLAYIEDTKKLVPC